MARQLLQKSLHFEDVEPGDWFDTPSRVVCTADIDTFAKLTGDNFGIHMDEAQAQALGFPARVAHGLLILSIIDGLKNNSEAGFTAVASLGWNWTFSKPVFPGDEIKARITVLKKRRTSKPGRAILTLGFSASNQAQQEIQAGTNDLMVLTREVQG